MMPMARILFFGEVFGKLAALGWWFFEPWSPAGWVLFCAADGFVLYHLFVPSGQWLCRVVTSFETDEKEVWLTVDDGPDAGDTPQILDLLERHGARATFFVVGERVARWPHLVDEIVRRGHEIAHHTQSHPVASFWCASRARLESELDDTIAVLRTQSVRPVLFRAPVGIKNFFLSTALKKRGMHCVGWTIRSGDCLGRRAEDVVETVMRKIRPGAIILLHEGVSVRPDLRVRTISLLLDALSAQGYRCVVPGLELMRPRVERLTQTALSRSPFRSATQVGVGRGVSG